jgi:hypothetical protein
MQIIYLKFMKKYLVSYHGKALAVGDNLAQALADAIYLATLSKRGYN